MLLKERTSKLQVERNKTFLYNSSALNMKKQAELIEQIRKIQR
jgi:hypothetical protein